MMSAVLLKILIVEYFIMMCVAASESKAALALYWFGALVLNVAVYMMSKA